MGSGDVLFVMCEKRCVRNRKINTGRTHPNLEFRPLYAIIRYIGVREIEGSMFDFALAHELVNVN